MAKKILLIDDDPDFIEINKTILESGGYVTDTAGSSAEALAKIRANEYDLVIIDLIMEELDSGFTIAYNIRDSARTRDWPILMLTSVQEKTGFSFDLAKDQAWMKVDDFAAKPLRPAELLQRIAALLRE
ncbi:response regulator [candidate division KSB1 bacterium]|nr:response regulator [candidate division KSB1 bacterium]RQW06706.1 MAG: DNA-binding response regulator [candidate division KSB1 bacterium]